MGMGGRHHCLPVPKQQLGRVKEEALGGAQESAAESSTAAKSGAASTTTTQVQDAGGMEAREEESELPSSGGQDPALPPGLTIVFSLPTSHAPVDLSPEAISIHSSTQSLHPSAGLMPPPPTCKALAMAHLERTLVLVRSAVAKATPSSSYTMQVMQPPAEAAHTMNNEWYQAINNNSWYKYKPDQHISGVKLRWENPNMPNYATYLKPEMQAGNPILMGSMGPGQPVYDTDLQAQPYHAAEPEDFPEVSFNWLSSPLDPCIDRAISALGDLGIIADIFHLRQLLLKYMDHAQQMAYLGHEQNHIQCDQGLLHLAKQNLELEGAVIKEHLRAARVFLCITPHLNYDRKPGEVPAQLLYPHLTNREVRYEHNMQSTARLARGRQGGHSYRLAIGRGVQGAQGTRHECPYVYCDSRQHAPEECTRPHIWCTGKECKVPPTHACHELQQSLCPYYALHTSSDCMDPQEEAYALKDILYLNDDENRMD
jgi:hypothetical protein